MIPDPWPPAAALEFPVHALPEVAGLSAWERCRDDPGAKLAHLLTNCLLTNCLLARGLDSLEAPTYARNAGAPGYLNGVTAPGDDAGHIDTATLILKATIRSGIRIPSRSRRVAGPVSPSCTEWPEPARHGASAPCLGAAWDSLDGILWMGRKSDIDDRVHNAVMLEKALAARRLRFSLNFA